jgi:hypothetical protein
MVPRTHYSFATTPPYPVIGVLLALLSGCTPDAPVAPTVATLFGDGAVLAASGTPLRLSTAPDTVRVGVSFELRLTDRLVDFSRRRPQGTTVAWETSDTSVVTLSVASANPDRVRATFRRAEPATITARLDGREGSWRGTAVALGNDTTLGSAGAPALPANSPAELPRMQVQLPTAEGTGQIRRVRRGGNLQSAIDAAGYGDVILLEAGATFTGPIQLRRKAGSGWITIRTDATPTAAGQRVTLADTLRFARIEAPATGNAHALNTEAGAAGYWIVNVDIARSPNAARLTTLIALGDGGTAQNSQASVPSRLVFDRVIVRGRPGLILRRCIALNSASTAVLNSVVMDCHEKGADSQAIGGWNGPGPFLIRNNLLEGAGENVMFGGSDPFISGLIPSDIVIERNHFRKPEAWFRSSEWTVKNLLELKVGKRVLVRGNLFENNWADGQSGVALVFKSVNQSGGAPWSETSDLTIVDNILRRSAGGITLAARPEVHPAVPMSKILIARNSIYGLGRESGFNSGTERALLVMGGVAHVRIEDNTISAPASVIAVVRDGNPPLVPSFVFRRNLARFGQFGIHGGGSGLASFNASYTSVDFAENCIFGAPALSQPGFSPGAHLSTQTENVALPGLAQELFSPAATLACPRLANGAQYGAPAAALRTTLDAARSGR